MKGTANIMAFLYKRGNIWWIGEYNSFTSKREDFSTKTSDDKQAKRELEIYQSKKSLGIISHAPTYKLSMAFEMFKSAKQRTQKSVRAYKIALDRWYEVTGDKDISRYTRQDYFNFLTTLQNRKVNGKNISVNSIANYTRHLYAIFKWLQHEGFIPKNIITKTRVELDEPHPIPLDDFKIITSLLSGKNGQILMLAYYLALRIMEVQYLKDSDFDFEHKRIRVNNAKGHRIEFIPMLKDTEIYLKSNNIELPLVYTYSGIRSYYARLMKKLGMNYNIHQLRATRGTYLANKNANPANLQKFMRHRDIRTTYAHYSKIYNQSILDDLNNCL
jgi:integrase